MKKGTYQILVILCFIAISLIFGIVYLVVINFSSLVAVIKKIPLAYVISYGLGCISTITSTKLSMKAIRKASVK